MENILLKLNDEQFVDFCFFYFLKRQADQKGKKHFLYEIKAGVSRLEIIRGFVSSPEYLNLLEKVTVSDPPDSRQHWTPYTLEQVVDTDVTRLSVRNYIEQKNLRRLLEEIDSQRKIEKAVEFGCGFGRMTQVLTEFTHDVTGIEREASFVTEAGRLIPEVKFIQADDLSSVPLESESADVIVSFTFLQHLINEQARKVAAEMIRCLKKGGTILLCEETDEGHTAGDTTDPLGQCTIGRGVRSYEDYFSPLTLTHTEPRRLEPGYPRQDTGTYMLFTSSVVPGLQPQQ
jgi:SAM-dependent methyltransferase